MVYHGPSGGCRGCRTRRIKVGFPTRSFTGAKMLMPSSAIEPNQDATTAFGDGGPVQATTMCLTAPTDLKTKLSNAESKDRMLLKVQNNQGWAKRRRAVKALWSSSLRLRPIRQPQFATRNHLDRWYILPQKVNPGRLAMRKTRQQIAHQP